MLNTRRRRTLLGLQQTVFQLLNPSQQQRSSRDESGGRPYAENEAGLDIQAIGIRTGPERLEPIF